jgi:hypothetical protein
MAEELVVMSTREIDRLGVIQQVLARRVSRVKAGELLGLSAKHVARLCVAYERQGAAGLVIEYEGQRLPYKLCDEYPFVTPGEVVERKRVAEMMAQIHVAQRDPARVREAAARIALRDAHVVSLKPDPYPRVESPASIVEVVPMDRGEAVSVQEGYIVRWIRKRPFLYKRALSSKTTADGRPAFEDTFVGTLADDVAREWQRTGDPAAPPPLSQAVAASANPQRFVPAPAPELEAAAALRRPPPSRKPRRPSTAMRPRVAPAEPPAPPPPPDPATRLATAIWYTDAFHTADTDRLREWNSAVVHLHSLGTTGRAPAKEQAVSAVKPVAPVRRRRALRPG